MRSERLIEGNLGFSKPPGEPKALAAALGPAQLHDWSLKGLEGLAEPERLPSGQVALEKRTQVLIFG